jgi:ADP-heptose:LPS heptosyltransferase
VPSIPDVALLNWLKARKLPVFSELTPSRLAGLLQKTDVIVSGKTIYFELASLLQRPSVGIFTEEELRRHCRNTPFSIGITYSQRPNEVTITEIGESVGHFVR